MTEAHEGTRGNEATMWTDEAMHAAYKEAFDKDPDAHHWALLSWIRDDMQQALAASAAACSAALARIAELEAQLAERSEYEWTPVAGSLEWGTIEVALKNERAALCGCDACKLGRDSIDAALAFVREQRRVPPIPTGAKEDFQNLADAVENFVKALRGAVAPVVEQIDKCLEPFFTKLKAEHPECFEDGQLRDDWLTVYRKKTP